MTRICAPLSSCWRVPKGRAKRSCNMSSQGPLCSEAKRGGTNLRRGRGDPAKHGKPTTKERLILAPCGNDQLYGSMCGDVWKVWAQGIPSLMAAARAFTSTIPVVSQPQWQRGLEVRRYDD